jgi:2-dehydro-3-deoxygluconokinase
MAKKKVLCFGELLLRISPAVGNDAAEKQPVLVYVGGAEANVATALAGWDVPVKYCTVLPDNFMAKHMMHYLEYHGVYTSSVLFSGKRIGLYYLERGADLKGSMVYDREGSSFSELQPGIIDWDRVLQDVGWFNFSAITPALNQNLADVCAEALEACVKKGITISVDLNYRSRLWKYGKQPVDIMPSLVQHCDVVMGNIWSAHAMIGTAIEEQVHDKKSKKAYTDHAAATSAEIIKKFPKCKVVANTFRFDSDKNKLLYYTTLFAGGKEYISSEFTTAGVVDRSGSGDCFMAGLIYGLYNQHEKQELLDFATAAAFGKLQEQGDATGQDRLTVSRVKMENT